MSSRVGSASSTVEVLENLINEVRLTDHRLVQVAERLHSAAPVTVSERALLEYLASEGPETVPGIARARHVTRQHVQAGINRLLEAELVEQSPNPAHARSHLIALTRAGRRLFESMRAAERDVLGSLPIDLAPEQLESASSALLALREALERIN